MIETAKRNYLLLVFVFSIAREHSTPTRFLDHRRSSPETRHSRSLGIGDHLMPLRHRAYNRRFGLEEKVTAEGTLDYSKTLQP